MTTNIPPPLFVFSCCESLERITKVVKHRAIEAAESTRASLSSLLSIETLILSFEAVNLRSEILPDRYAFTIPSIPILHTAPLPVALPDLFLLVTPSFWQPFTLWLATALVAPLAFAYFFNLTGRHSRGTQRFEYQFDPLTFNVAKAIITYAVFAGGYTFFGLVDLESIRRICSAAAGGWEGIVGGCAVSALATVYEALIKVQVQRTPKTSKIAGSLRNQHSKLLFIKKYDLANLTHRISGHCKR